MTKQLLTHLMLAAMLCFFSTAQASQISEIKVEAEFDSVLQDLSDAIINRGYKIDYQAFVGDMLKRTAADIEGSHPIYKDAQLLQFCSAVLSRKAMQANPANLAFCPYILFVYERVDEVGQVRVGFRRLDEVGSEASKKALAAVNSVLQKMIEEAADQ
jgi:uncharacterized protein (DUF302 family)